MNELSGVMKELESDIAYNLLTYFANWTKYLLKFLSESNLSFLLSKCNETRYYING